MEIDSILPGKVTGITKFGAFVALPEGRSGMVHISEVAHSYVNDIREHLTEGQEVTVRVIGVSPEGRVNLSIKKAAPPPRRETASVAGTRRAPAGPPSFEDKLKAFMADSESKMSGIRRQENKGSKRRK
ncbi:MAG: S1 RNA-binding domain-containing protein [Oscillospiraceae bacterium]|jgi:S1 RNA binding domain protein|nr:S1 RNA-binding domain-containing protein [Oscillospiraceae bacterium]